MKLLLDQNLSHRLVPVLSAAFPDSAHVRDLGLARARDRDVWDFARTNDFAILTKDSDFAHLSFLLGPPPKVIWVTVGNASTGRIGDVVSDQFHRIREFAADETAAILVLP